MARIFLLLLLVAVFLAVASASSAPTFCKCTCFKNSTIIPLGPEHQQKGSRSPNSEAKLEHDPLEEYMSPPLIPESMANPPDQAQEQLKARSASSSCSACTKAFCLSQGISFCKDAKEEDVFTMCFQRDSNKDKIMVWGFIVGTIGLLGWAGFKRAVEWRDGRSTRQDINYAPIRR